MKQLNLLVLLMLFVTGCGQNLHVQSASSVSLLPGLKIEGDMILPINNNGVSAQEVFDSANAGVWPNGIIPLKFVDYFPESQKALIWNACREWELSANVRCVDGSNYTSGYL
jgi:hypothetical protein